MQKRKWILYILFVFAIVAGCKKEESEIGLFSWKKEALSDCETLFADMKSLGITEVYQAISDSIESDVVEEFLASAQEKQMSVYLLVGEPDWALEEDAENLIEKIDRVVEINALVEEEAHLKGIMVDVEPYLLDEWDEDSDELMKSYVESMKCAHEYATKQGVRMILCIPYFYDNKEYDEELETLIADGCDGVAVMNYYRNSEISNIKEEVAYVEKYDKIIISIYEMKEAGSHGLTEKNTYHELGFDVVKENFKEMLEEYEESKIKMAYHDYEAMKEVMKDE